jgi:hypothetical protein
MPGKGMDALEYQIAATIRNQTIERPVDHSREREFIYWLLVGAVVIAAAIFDGSQRFDGRYGYSFQMDPVQKKIAEETEIHRRLTLELAVLQDPRRIEDLATRQLAMVAPGRLDAVVIPRIVAPPQPPVSVVALR